MNKIFAVQEMCLCATNHHYSSQVDSGCVCVCVCAQRMLGQSGKQRKIKSLSFSSMQKKMI